MPKEREPVNQDADRRVNRFGGDWTAEKLDILAKYLDAYTNVMQKQSFGLVYIDAFAGTGDIGVRKGSPGKESTIEGSARRALSVTNRQFDRLILVDKIAKNVQSLNRIKEENPNRTIEIINADANDFLAQLNFDWNHWRGVLLLDPFGTEVDWATIERIARFKALDTWLLFPIGSVSRTLPRSRNPDDVSEQRPKTLKRIFGDDSWRNLYRGQQDLFGDTLYSRDKGHKQIIQLYKGNLKELFGSRYLDISRPLSNSKNSTMFDFIFCVGSDSERAIAAAKGIARNVLRKRE